MNRVPKNNRGHASAEVGSPKIMSLKKITIKVLPSHHKLRLDHFLFECLPPHAGQPLSKGKLRKLIIAGAVYLNGKRVRIASKEVIQNAVVSVFIDWAKINQDLKSQDIPFEMRDEQVLFEDEHLIVVEKPPGLPTQPTVDEARDNLYAAVKAFIARRDKVPAHSVYLGLHHRLDRDTSGILVFTKSKEANPGMSEVFSAHQAEKVYNALVYFDSSSEPSPQWTTRDYLARSTEGGQKSKKAKFRSVRSGGDFAETEFLLKEKLSRALWVEARPRTGRTHQIRVHLSEKGLPILGDPHYGGPIQVGALKIPRVMLHAVSLTFPHPIHKNRIAIRSSLPGDFNQCIEALRKRGHSVS